MIERSAVTQGALAPFATELSRWFDKTGVAAVLVRPDRFVFGTGSPAELRAAWDKALSPHAPCAAP